MNCHRYHRIVLERNSIIPDKKLPFLEGPFIHHSMWFDILQQGFGVVFFVVGGERTITVQTSTKIRTFHDYRAVAVQMYTVPPHSMRSVWAYQAAATHTHCRLRKATMSVSHTYSILATICNSKHNVLQHLFLPYSRRF